MSKLVLILLLQLSMSLVLGVAVLYFSMRIIRSVIFRKIQNKEHNTAFSIVSASILFSVGNIIEGTIEPITTTFRILNETYETVSEVILQSLKYISFILGISIVITVFINFVAIKLYNSFTKFDEFDEISKENIGIAIISGAVLITISIFVKQPAIELMEAIVPYPKINSVF